MLQRCSILVVAGVFFDEPTTSHYLIEISQKSSLAHTSVKNYLKQLKKLLIVQESVEKKGSRKFPLYHANIESHQYRKYKRLYNIFRLEESGLIDYLKDRLTPKSMVLFGSYARGEDIENSDIDIFIESKKTLLELTYFEKQLKRKIQVHIKEHISECQKEIKNNIINGINLSGYLEVFK